MLVALGSLGSGGQRKHPPTSPCSARRSCSRDITPNQYTTSKIIFLKRLMAKHILYLIVLASQWSIFTSVASSQGQNDFIYPPVIIHTNNDIIVGAGCNATLECTARGSAPITFVWFQDQKNQTRPGAPIQIEPSPSTKLSDENRFKISEEQSPHNTTTSRLLLLNLKPTDTSIFLCWVENPAGYTLGNFSLIVDNSPLTGATSSSGLICSLGNSIFQLFGVNESTVGKITVVLTISLLLLIIAVIFLLVFKLMIGSYSCYISDLKSHQINPKLSVSNKFSGNMDRPVGKSAGMFAYGNAVVASEDDADYDQASSCQLEEPDILSVNHNFIEQLRSGIINMHYHNLSPVIQFNQIPSKNQQEQQQRHQQIRQQLPQFNRKQQQKNLRYYCKP